jgi:glutamyl-tRNA synthetase
VVDDTAMKITHIIRGDEWISSVPMHLLIYKALGYEPPLYVHHPMLLGPNRAKLSKRHGDVAVLQYREKGYLPDALFNFLALIGWSLDDKTEIMTRQELIDNFSLERISKTGALFNWEKLEWMNGLYIRNLSLDDFMERSLPYLERGLPETVKRPLDTDYLKRTLELVQERSKTLAEVSELVSFFFVEECDYEPELLIGKKMTKEDSVKVLEVSLDRLHGLGIFDTESLENLLRPLAEELELKTGQLFGTLRVATTGRTAAPPLFQTMEVLGKDTCLDRIEKALKKLKS